MSEPATVVIEIEEKKMALDIPEGIGTLLLNEAAGNIQANNRDGRNLATIAMGSLQAGVAKTHNELGPVESRAVSGVMATPNASPTTQAGP